MKSPWHWSANMQQYLGLDDFVVGKGALRCEWRKLLTGAVDEAGPGLRGGPRQGPPQKRIVKERMIRVIIHIYRFMSSREEFFPAAPWHDAGAIALSGLAASVSGNGQKTKCPKKIRGDG